jgi:hypothetical protein
MLREKWDRGTMSAADWDTATIGALRMQCVWRGFMDRRRMFYRREYVQWGSVQMEHLRCALSALTYAIMAPYIAFTTYLCLIYGVKFSPTQAALWITSTGWATLIELFVQEPVLILSSTVVVVVKKSLRPNGRAYRRRHHRASGDVVVRKATAVLSRRASEPLSVVRS